MKVDSMLEDPRKIVAVSEGSWSARVGQDGITEIVCYPEFGEMAYVPWVALFRGEELWQRVKVTSVQYEDLP